MKINGFTLIELLIVIAIVGILSAAILAAINPFQKINQANDAKVKSDIAQIATAATAYFTVHQHYPGEGSVQGDLVPGELNSYPVPPNVNYSYVYSGFPAGGCTNLTCTRFSIYATLLAPVTQGDVWCFRSSTGITGESTIAACSP